MPVFNANKKKLREFSIQKPTKHLSYSLPQKPNTPTAPCLKHPLKAKSITISG